MPIPLRLIVQDGGSEPQEHRFERDIVKIGRLASAHLKLEDARVSRIHAVVEAGNDGQDYAIIDMGSTEGTFVNERKVSKERLADGDVIAVGPYRIRVAYGETKAAPPPPDTAEPMSTGDVLIAQPEPGASGGIPAPAVSGGDGASGLYAAAAPTGIHPAMSVAAAGASAAAAPTGVHPAGATASGVHPAAPSTGFDPAASGVYPSPAASGAPPSPRASGDPAASGAYPRPASSMPIGSGASGVYPAPAASGAHPAAAVWGGGAPEGAPAPGGHAHPTAAAVYPSAPATGGLVSAEASGVHAPPVGSQAAAAASGIYPAPSAVGQAPSPTGAGQDVVYPAQPPSALPAYGTGYHPGWTPPASVPNNLASASVPDDERALEVKLIWGNSVIDTVTATEQPRVTLGDERKVSGFGPTQKVVRCDIEVPSRGLPHPTHVLAERQGQEGTTYLLQLPPGLVGRVERADGMVIPLDLLYQGQHGGERDGAGGARYLLRAEETVYLGYGELVLQIRYVRRTRLVVPPIFSRINYIWANTLVLAIFFHLIAISSFLAAPEVTPKLADELFENRNRFIQTRLKLAEKKKKPGGGLLEELEKGPSQKAKNDDGKAGRRKAEHAKKRMAHEGKPDEKEQAERALELLGLGGKGRNAGLFGRRGLGGELESAMGGLRGRQVGDARGLGGLGTRGTGPGGGGLALASVGIGELGTAGRGGNGEGGLGYGQGAADLGEKKERDVEITAGRTVVRGSLSKEIIRRVIQKHMAQIRYCYEKELQRSPGLFGKVATKFEIAANGQVNYAKVIKSTMNNREVERCITARIESWRFPEPEGGGIVEVNYPFILKTAG